MKSILPRLGLAVLAASLSFGALAPGVGSAAPAAAPDTQQADPRQADPPQAKQRATDAVIQRHLDRLVSRTGFPGATVVVKGRDGKVRTYRSGAGDLTTEAPMPRRPVVRIGSNAKMFTATVVLQLAAEGLVDLDARVERYLPGLVRRNGNDGRKITVRQLLQQRSGLPDYDHQLLEAAGTLRKLSRTYYEPHELVDAALAERRVFKPGTRWAYSNTNYILLGLLAQRVTGRPISELVTQRIIKPIGLKDTYWPTPGVQRIRGVHPRGYLADGPGGTWRDSTRIDPSMGWSAGQLIGTPQDIGRFMEKLMSGDLLPPAQLKEMRQTVRAPRFDAKPGWRYGLGLASHRLTCGGLGWGHGGDIQGFQTRNLVTNDGRWAVVAANGLATTLEMVGDVSAMVDTALCRS
ncbi:serine hydrolase [Nocardioides sp. cx-173]|uniref:serine hydrolase domain-containing protein n=1 Tax=Nocardioides sp. cx-173 TaxID=2898796 RepID=UPI001E533AAA|nr:serine hydrolase domain-containing protein [Nocardioides sp. cx-173]MCD4523357.1 beta-lactamase family protein [Nocardioides sp. cx-173]UGB42303.1 beta-lactamase family protein [Nocardioides sp. cx-173]